VNRSSVVDAFTIKAVAEKFSAEREDDLKLQTTIEG
jgi:hypothetical protein